MEPIYPITEDNIRQYNGNMVLVVLNDGNRHIGVLSACRDGKLHLNGEAANPVGVPDGDRVHHHKPGKRRKKKLKRRLSHPTASTARTQSFSASSDPFFFPPLGSPIGTAIAIDIALIAFLFLLI